MTPEFFLPATLVLGEPGIGKTTVLRQAAARHRGPIFRVACRRVASTIHLDPIVTLMHSLIRSFAGENHAERAHARDPMAVLVRALDRATRTAGVLVQFDDLHWADQATRDAIPSLVERFAGRRLHWHLSARAGYDSVGILANRLRAARHAAVVTLGPLPDAAISALLEAKACALDLATRRTILERAKGNPLYAELLLSSGGSSSRDIAEAAQEHIGDLTGLPLTLAATLAAHAEPMNVARLANVAQTTPETALAALHTLIDRGIIEQRQGEYELRHVLLSDALLRACPPEHVRSLARSPSVLTGREQTIALMIASGKTNAEIAVDLSLSRRTIEHHVDHIRNKLGVRSRVDVAMHVTNAVLSQQISTPAKR
jgi:DNA-binding CsgD family transcriptional regulator